MGVGIMRFLGRGEDLETKGYRVGVIRGGVNGDHICNKWTIGGAHAKHARRLESVREAPGGVCRSNGAGEPEVHRRRCRNVDASQEVFTRRWYVLQGQMTNLRKRYGMTRGSRLTQVARKRVRND